MKNLDNVGRVTVFLRKAFRLMNEQLFNGELQDVQITLVNSARIYGHITLDSNTWQTSKGYGMHEIAISNNYLSSEGISIEDVMAVLCHECCHLWAMQNSIKDTSRGFTYHNSRYRTIAEEHGLIVEHSEKYGWSHTKPGDKILQFCLDNDFTDIQINRKADYPFFGGRGGGSPSSTGIVPPSRQTSARRLVCPACGLICRVTKRDARVSCLTCSLEMIET